MCFEHMWLLAVKRGKGWRGIDPALRCWLALLHSADFRSWVSDFGGGGVKPQPKVTNPWSKSVTHDRIFRAVRMRVGVNGPRGIPSAPNLRAAYVGGVGVHLQKTPRHTIFSGFSPARGGAAPYLVRGAPYLWR